MPVGYCPDTACDKAIDLDGFGEHGIPTLWYCRCEKIYTHGPEFGNLTEVPKEEVNLKPTFQYGAEGRTPKPGEFIIALRWERVRKPAHEFIYATMREFAHESALQE